MSMSKQLSNGLAAVEERYVLATPHPELKTRIRALVSEYADDAFQWACDDPIIGKSRASAVLIDLDLLAASPDDQVNTLHARLAREYPETTVIATHGGELTPRMVHLAIDLAAIQTLSLRDSHVFSLQLRAALAVAQREYRRTQLLDIVTILGEISPSVSGARYLDALVEVIATTLRLSHVFVGRIVGEDRTAVETVSLYANGKLAPNFSYSLLGTPCRYALDSGRVCYHPDAVIEAYPEDILLQQMNVRTYIGSPIALPNGELQGILVALDEDPRPNNELLPSVFDFFAVRAGAELEREAIAQRQAQLTAELEQEVQRRTQEVEATHRRMLLMAHQAGMADVANGVVHNLGNFLTSSNSSVMQLRQLLDKNTLVGLQKTASMLRQNRGRLAELLTEPGRGSLFIDYFESLESTACEERAQFEKEVLRLTHIGELMAQAIRAQQQFAVPASYTTFEDINQLVSEAAELFAADFKRQRIEIGLQLGSIRPVSIQRTKAVQVLLNVLKNAAEALSSQPPDKARLITLRTMAVANDEVHIHIRDNGPGISQENLQRIFRMGSSEKGPGRGIGLHSSINLMREMNGDIQCHSKGLGMGTTFTLIIPAKVQLRIAS